MKPAEIRISDPSWVEAFVDKDHRYRTDAERIHLAIDLARQNVLHDTGGPFGAAVFERDSGRVVAVGTTSVVRLNNSALHAEMVAFMMAQASLDSYTLRGEALATHELFTSCEPCAMCLGAVLWSGVTRVVFAATRDDARRLRFDEGPVFPQSYEYLAERGLTVTGGLHRDEANEVFALYESRGGRIDRKSTRLNSSHSQISYAVFCLK